MPRKQIMLDSHVHDNVSTKVQFCMLVYCNSKFNVLIGSLSIYVVNAYRESAAYTKKQSINTTLPLFGSILGIIDYESL